MSLRTTPAPSGQIPIRPCNTTLAGTTSGSGHTRFPGFSFLFKSIIAGFGFYGAMRINRWWDEWRNRMDYHEMMKREEAETRFF